MLDAYEQYDKWYYEYLEDGGDDNDIIEDLDCISYGALRGNQIDEKFGMDFQWSEAARFFRVDIDSNDDVEILNRALRASDAIWCGAKYFNADHIGTCQLFVEDMEEHIIIPLGTPGEFRNKMHHLVEESIDGLLKF